MDITDLNDEVLNIDQGPIKNKSQILNKSRDSLGRVNSKLADKDNKLFNLMPDVYNKDYNKFNPNSSNSIRQFSQNMRQLGEQITPDIVLKQEGRNRKNAQTSLVDKINNEKNKKSGKNTLSQEEINKFKDLFKIKDPLPYIAPSTDPSGALKIKDSFNKVLDVKETKESIDKVNNLQKLKSNYDLNVDKMNAMELADEISPYYRQYKNSDYLKGISPEKWAAQLDLFKYWANEKKNPDKAVRMFDNFIKDTVADKQEWYKKLGYGIMGVGSSAMSFFITTYGMIDGLNSALQNFVFGKEKASFRNLFDHIIDNDITRYGNDVSTYGSLFPDVIQKQKEIGLSKLNIAVDSDDSLLSFSNTASFLQSHGFTIATMLMGQGLSKLTEGAEAAFANGLSRMGVNTIEAAAKVEKFNRYFTRPMTAIVNPLIASSSEMTAEAISTKLGVLEDGEQRVLDKMRSNAAEKASQNLKDDIKNGNVIPVQTSSGTSYYVNDGTYSIEVDPNDYFNKAIEEDYSENYEKNMREVRERAISAGNANFLSNAVIVGAVSTLVSSLYTTAGGRKSMADYKDAFRRKLGFKPKPKFKVEAKDITLDSPKGEIKISPNMKGIFKNKYVSGVGRVLKNAAAEGIQEGFQNTSDNFLQGYNVEGLNQYLEHTYSGKNQDDFAEDYSKMLSVGMDKAIEGFKDGSTFYEMWAGFVSTLLFPTFRSARRSRVRDANGNIVEGGYFTRGINDKGNRESFADMAKRLNILSSTSLSTFKERVGEIDELNRQADELQEWVNDKNNRELLGSICGLNALEDSKKKAAAQDDLFEFKNLEKEKKVRAARMVSLLKNTEIHDAFMKQLDDMSDVDKSEEAQSILINSIRQNVELSSKYEDKSDQGIINEVKKNAEEFKKIYNEVESKMESTDNIFGMLDHNSKLAIVNNDILVEDLDRRGKKIKEDGEKVVEAVRRRLENNTNNEDSFVEESTEGKSEEEIKDIEKRREEKEKINDARSSSVEARLKYGTKTEALQSSKKKISEQIDTVKKTIEELEEYTKGDKKKVVEEVTKEPSDKEEKPSKERTVKYVTTDISRREKKHRKKKVDGLIKKQNELLSRLNKDLTSINKALELKEDDRSVSIEEFSQASIDSRSVFADNYVLHHERIENERQVENEKYDEDLGKNDVPNSELTAEEIKKLPPLLNDLYDSNTLSLIASISEEGNKVVNEDINSLFYMKQLRDEARINQKAKQLREEKASMYLNARDLKAFTEKAAFKAEIERKKSRLNKLFESGSYSNFKNTLVDATMEAYTNNDQALSMAISDVIASNKDHEYIRKYEKEIKNREEIDSVLNSYWNRNNIDGKSSEIIENEKVFSENLFDFLQDEDVDIFNETAVADKLNEIDETTGENKFLQYLNDKVDERNVALDEINDISSERGEHFDVSPDHFIDEYKNIMEKYYSEKSMMSLKERSKERESKYKNKDTDKRNKNKKNKKEKKSKLQKVLDKVRKKNTNKPKNSKPTDDKVDTDKLHNAIANRITKYLKDNNITSDININELLDKIQNYIANKVVPDVTTTEESNLIQSISDVLSNKGTLLNKYIDDTAEISDSDVGIKSKVLEGIKTLLNDKEHSFEVSPKEYKENITSNVVNSMILDYLSDITSKDNSIRINDLNNLIDNIYDNVRGYLKSGYSKEYLDNIDASYKDIVERISNKLKDINNLEDDDLSSIYNESLKDNYNSEERFTSSVDNLNKLSEGKLDKDSFEIKSFIEQLRLKSSGLFGTEVGKVLSEEDKKYLQYRYSFAKVLTLNEGNSAGNSLFNSLLAKCAANCKDISLLSTLSFLKTRSITDVFSKYRITSKLLNDNFDKVIEVLETLLFNENSKLSELIESSPDISVTDIISSLKFIDPKLKSMSEESIGELLNSVGVKDNIKELASITKSLINNIPQLSTHIRDNQNAISTITKVTSIELLKNGETSGNPKTKMIKKSVDYITALQSSSEAVISSYHNSHNISEYVNNNIDKLSDKDTKVRIIHDPNLPGMPVAVVEDPKGSIVINNTHYQPVAVLENIGRNNSFSVVKESIFNMSKVSSPVFIDDGKAIFKPKIYKREPKFGRDVSSRSLNSFGIDSNTFGELIDKGIITPVKENYGRSKLVYKIPNTNKSIYIFSNSSNVLLNKDGSINKNNPFLSYAVSSIVNALNTKISNYRSIGKRVTTEEFWNDFTNLTSKFFNFGNVGTEFAFKKSPTNDGNNFNVDIYSTKIKNNKLSLNYNLDHWLSFGDNIISEMTYDIFNELLTHAVDPKGISINVNYFDKNHLKAAFEGGVLRVNSTGLTVDNYVVGVEPSKFIVDVPKKSTETVSEGVLNINGVIYNTNTGKVEKGKPVVFVTPTEKTETEAVVETIIDNTKSIKLTEDERHYQNVKSGIKYARTTSVTPAISNTYNIPIGGKQFVNFINNIKSSGKMVTALRAIVAEHGVRGISKFLMDNARSEGHLGSYSMNNNTLSLSVNKNASDEEIAAALTHEYIHSLTSDKISQYFRNKNSVTSRERKAIESLISIKDRVTDFLQSDDGRKIIEEAKNDNNLNKAVDYYLSHSNRVASLKEFLAEVYSNPKLIEIINNIPSGKQNIISRIGNFFRNLLGLPKSIDNSTIQEIYQTAIPLLEERNSNRFDSDSPWITPSTNIGTGMDEFTRDYIDVRNARKGKTLIKKEYVGKVIYAEAGLGKTFISDRNENVIDGDNIWMSLLNVSNLEELNEAFKELNNKNPDERNHIYNTYKDAVKNLAKEGFTVLTSYKGSIEDADFIVRHKSPVDAKGRTTFKDGDVYNELSRKTLDSIIKDNPDIKKKITELSKSEYLSSVLLDNSADSMPKMRESYPNMTREQYRKYAEKLESVIQSLELKGWTIIPKDVTVTGTVEVNDVFGNKYKVNVAGTLDLLAYDREGNFHIIDMKTYRSREFDNAKSEKYAKQLYIYKQLLEDKYGIKVKSVQVLGIPVNYEAPGKSVNYTVSNTEKNQLLVNGKKYIEASIRDNQVKLIDIKAPKSLEAHYELLSENEKEAILTTAFDKEIAEHINNKDTSVEQIVESDKGSPEVISEEDIKVKNIETDKVEDMNNVDDVLDTLNDIELDFTVSAKTGSFIDGTTKLNEIVKPQLQWGVWSGKVSFDGRMMTSEEIKSKLEKITSEGIYRLMSDIEKQHLLDCL